jgi:hypothetical protein
LDSSCEPLPQESESIAIFRILLHFFARRTEQVIVEEVLRVIAAFVRSGAGLHNSPVLTASREVAKKRGMRLRAAMARIRLSSADKACPRTEGAKARTATMVRAMGLKWC